MGESSLVVLQFSLELLSAKFCYFELLKKEKEKDKNTCCMTKGLCLSVAIKEEFAVVLKCLK